MIRRILIVGGIAFTGLLNSGCSQQVSFADDIYPVLEANCLECHRKGQKGHQESGLSLETYAELMTGTKFGPVVKPCDSLSSTLLRLIDHKADPAINMPHDKNKIAEKDIALIKTWIDQGAKNN